MSISVRSRSGARPASAGLGAGGDGWLPLPLGLVSDLPALPFDVHVRVGSHAVLYARREADPVSLIARADAASIPELVIHADDAATLRSILLATLVAAGDPATGAPRDAADRSRRIAGAATALLEPVLAASGGRPGTDALVVAADAARLAGRAIGRDSSIAGRILHRRPASAAARRIGAAGGRVHLDRALDGIALAATLAGAAGVDPGDAAEAAALRDLAVASGVDARRHMLVGADTVRAAGRPDAVAAAIEAHHERLDGSGGPLGLAADRLGALERITALVDLVVGMTRRDGGGGLPIGEAFRALRMAVAGRFDGRLVLALATSIADGTLAPTPGIGEARIDMTLDPRAGQSRFA